MTLGDMRRYLSCNITAIRSFISGSSAANIPVTNNKILNYKIPVTFKSAAFRYIFRLKDFVFVDFKLFLFLISF